MQMRIRIDWQLGQEPRNLSLRKSNPVMRPKDLKEHHGMGSIKVAKGSVVEIARESS